MAARLAGHAVECVTITPAAGDPWFEGCEVTLGGAAHAAALDFFSLSAALDTATRQAIASFVWHGGARPDGRLHCGSARAFDGHAIRLDAIAGYSRALRVRYASTLAWTPATELVWVEGHSLRDGTPRWVPAQLVIGVGTAELGRSMAREPELRPRVPTGLGVHTERAGALLSALLDVVERDAFMVAWLDRLTTRSLDARGLGDSCGQACERLRGAGLEVRAAALPSDAPVPVVLATIQASDRDGPRLAVGVAARRTVAEAFVAALTRAFASYRRVRSRLAGGWAVPCDASRLNADTRALWWATAGPRETLDWLVRGEATDDDTDAATASDGDLVDTLTSWLATADEDAVAVDLADETLVAELRHHVIAVVAPRLHPLHVDEARPARASARLRTVPVALGRPLPAVLNTLPHPLG